MAARSPSELSTLTHAREQIAVKIRLWLNVVHPTDGPTPSDLEINKYSEATVISLAVCSGLAIIIAAMLAVHVYILTNRHEHVMASSSVSLLKYGGTNEGEM